MTIENLLSVGEKVIKYYNWNYKQLEFSKPKNELVITNKSLIYFKEDGASYEKIALKDIHLISTLENRKDDKIIYIIFINPCRYANQGFDINIGSNNKLLYDNICEQLFKLIGQDVCTY